MNRITSLAAHWWGGRTLRERRMVAVMNLLLLAVVVSLGVVRPVMDWRAAAADRAAVAADVLVEVRAGVAAIRPAGSTASAPAEGLEPLVRRTAEAAGLDVVTLMSPSGQLGFQLSRVGSGALFAWLAVLETDHRLTICSLGVTENADATLNVEGSVSAAGCAG
jgi:general secretion pathway protein M